MSATLVNLATEPLIILSLMTFVGTLVIVPILIQRLPSDYFTRAGQTRRAQDKHPVLFVLRNLLGVVLVLVGIIMLFVPGQGVLTILIGLSTMQFPGKYKLERKLVSNNSVFRSLNWIRSKAGKAPLEYPND